MPKLSIITVNLNNKDGLLNTAKSVVDQTWTDYEWIIIDGGSTDGSVDVIKEYAEKTDKLVYWCSEKDGGIYQGMNKGIDKANGKYCWFLNSGDCAYKNTTLDEIFANEFDEDVVYGDIIIGREQKTLMVTEKEKRIYSPGFWFHDTFPHQATITKSNILKTLKFDPQWIIAADHLFFMKAIFHNNARIKKISAIFCIFDNTGTSSVNNKDMRNEKKKIFEIFFNDYQCYFYHILSSIERGKIRKVTKQLKSWFHF
jgi:glycosyltransferase involved in cell wall biosynthesis